MIEGHPYQYIMNQASNNDDDMVFEGADKEQQWWPLLPVCWLLKLCLLASCLDVAEELIPVMQHDAGWHIGVVMIIVPMFHVDE